MRTIAGLAALLLAIAVIILGRYYAFKPKRRVGTMRINISPKKRDEK